jgi:hypothetical protein
MSTPTENRRRRLPSPALVLSLLALVMSAGGTVTAAALITSADIKDNTIRSVDIRDETIRSRDVDIGSLIGADIQNGSLTGTDVANDTLTRADVNESTLGQVPSAAGAGKVDGMDANSLTRVARTWYATPLPLTTSYQSFGNPLSITAPRAGFVMIHGSITALNEGFNCTGDCSVSSFIYHRQSGTGSTYAVESIPPGQVWANTSHAWVFPVNAGVNTFELRVKRWGPGGGIVRAYHDAMAAIYSPFGPTGAETLDPQS